MRPGPLLLALFALPASAADIPSPASFLGFQPGADGVLADWHQIAGYFHKLDQASDRVRVEEVGQTTEGLPFLVAIITSERNMARLEDIRADNVLLADPRRLSPAEAERLIARGPVVVSLQHGIHSTEVAAPHTAMLTAHELATAESAELRAVLDRVVVVMVPSHNPDGTQKVAAWQRRTAGTPYEASGCEAGPSHCRMPFLYQKYAGHDNNRDWYMFTQVESRLTLKHVYDRWRPQIVHDLHQMGTRGARLFLPPYLDPWEPNVDPALVAAVNAIGAHMAARLTAEGKAGVVTDALFDAWTPARAYPHTHGGVRVLSEAASPRLALPMEVAATELEPGPGIDPRRASAHFPNPWPGGSWNVRDVIAYQLSATRALLDHAAAHREYWLRTAHDVNRRASQRQHPFAFVVAAEQRDPLAAAALLEALRLGSVEVHRARQAFEAEGRRFAAGSSVVMMQQPFSAFAKSLLERQRYPELRPAPGAAAPRPYDVTAHTLPLLMGVEAVAVNAPFPADLEAVAESRVAPGVVEKGRGRYLALSHRNGDLIALGRLLRKTVPVRWLVTEHLEHGRRFPAGTLLVPYAARGLLEPMVKELGLEARVVRGAPGGLLVRRPRVGLYQSWLAPIDEGWTRYVFEHQVEVDYRTVHDGDLRAGGLRARFDAIVLPDQPPDQILAGHPPGSLPPEYTGGPGKEGARALSAFVEAGGTLVALDSASDFAIEELELPVGNVLAASAPAVLAVDCPGALLKATVNGDSPLAHGLDETTALWFESSPAFEPRAGTSVLTYPKEELLLSGWLTGGEALQGRAALVDVPKGLGRVVLFGFRPQYRAQSWATYVPLLNALYLSAAEPVRRGDD